MSAGKWKSADFGNGYILSNAWLDIAAPGTRHWLYDHLKISIIEKFQALKYKINSMRMAENDYEEFLVFYRRNRSIIHYNQNLLNQPRIKANNPSHSFDFSGIFGGKSEWRFMLKDQWLNRAENVVVSATLSNTPGGVEDITTAGGAKCVNGKEYYPDGTEIPPRNTNKSETEVSKTLLKNFSIGKIKNVGNKTDAISMAANMLKAGDEAARRNVFLCIVAYRKGNGIQWCAYPISYDEQGYPKEVTRKNIWGLIRAKDEIKAQYSRYNSLDLEKEFPLPDPFSYDPIPTQLIN